MKVSTMLWWKKITKMISKWLKKKKHNNCWRRLFQFRRIEELWLQLRIVKVSSKLLRSHMITLCRLLINQRFLLIRNSISFSKRRKTFYLSYKFTKTQRKKSWWRMILMKRNFWIRYQKIFKVHTINLSGPIS